MANFAELNEDNEVINVIVVASEDFTVDGEENEEAGKDLLEKWFGHRRWVQTSYTNSIRGRYASIGGTYDSDMDQFIGVKPYESWILNESTGEWEAPVPMPAISDGKVVFWNEEEVNWEVVDPQYPEPGDPDYVEVN